jgi:hypothetical protein
MSRRNSDDPLLRAFLDAYKLNLLAIPRENAQVGDVYVNTPTGISTPGALQFLLTPKFNMPKIETGEKMTDIAGTQTAALQFKVGISLLDGFFSVLGALGALDKVKAAYEHKRTGKLRFRFKDATRDSVDSLAFGKALIPCKLEERQPYVQPENSYYVTVGVVRSKSISISAKDEESNTVSLDVGALKKAIGVQGGLDVSQSSEGELTYSGPTALAFGVELVQLSYNQDENKFLLMPLAHPEKIRARAITEDRDIERSFIGGEEGNAFIKTTAGA